MERESETGDKFVCWSEEMKKEMKVDREAAVCVCVCIAWKWVDVEDLKVDEEAREEHR